MSASANGHFHAKNPAVATKLASACLLGLPAALCAHSVCYGSHHSAGAFYHNAFLEAALFASAFFLFALVRRAVQGAIIVSDWTGIVTRLERLLPGALSLALASIAWFALIERVDSDPHGVPPAALLAILIVTVLLLLSSRFFSRAVASIAIVVLAPITVPRAYMWRIGFREHSTVAARFEAFTLFARPPPSFA